MVMATPPTPAQFKMEVALMTETAIREMDIYAWLSVAACGYSLDRRQRARVSHFGRHVLAEWNNAMKSRRLADKHAFAVSMMDDGKRCSADDVPDVAVAGMLVKCLKRLDPQLSEEWLCRVNAQAKQYLAQGVIQ